MSIAPKATAQATLNPLESNAPPSTVSLSDIVKSLLMALLAAGCAWLTQNWANIESLPNLPQWVGALIYFVHQFFLMNQNGKPPVPSQVRNF